jgi:hypothetical protein
VPVSAGGGNTLPSAGSGGRGGGKRRCLRDGGRRHRAAVAPSPPLDSVGWEVVGSGSVHPSTGSGGRGGGGQQAVEQWWCPSLCRIGREGRWWVVVAPSPTPDPARREAGGGSGWLPLMFPGQVRRPA